MVEVDVVDVRTLQHALRYLYTDIYDDEWLPTIGYAGPVEAASQIKSNDQHPETEPKILHDDDLFPQEPDLESADARSHVSYHQIEEQSERLESEDLHQREHSNSRHAMESGDSHDCSIAWKDKSGDVCSNTKARTNTLVYIFADYYQISDLKILAVGKFAAALETVCREDLSDLCHLVYETAPSTAHNLRSCLSNALATHGQQLIGNASFMSTVLTLPEFLRDCFSSLVRLYQVASEEKDAAVTASLAAEDAAKEANRKGQDDKQRVVAQVNQARRCRHCALDNNVFFEQEGSHLGRMEYSFRCRCRTRY